jgi:putative endonuclease
MSDKKWHVYLLECADGTYYCGISTDPARRLREHNGLAPGGAKYTRSRRPSRILESVECPDQSSACALESAVKASPRSEKLAKLRRGAGSSSG